MKGKAVLKGQVCAPPESAAQTHTTLNCKALWVETPAACSEANLVTTGLTS